MYRGFLLRLVLTCCVAAAVISPALAVVGGYGFYETIGSGADAITVLHVGGTHYEMGYWHGYLLGDQVRANAASAIAVAELEGVTAEVWAWAIAAMWPYVPQDYLDEMRGLADGSGLTIEEVWKMHAIPDLSEYHCSAFAAMGAATVGGHDIQLRNLDWGLEFGIQQHPLLVVYEPDNGNKYVNVSFAGFLGVIAGMSYQQIPVSEMGDSFDYDNETLEGEPMPFLLKDVLEHAQSYTEAETMVRNANRTSSLWYTVSDPNEGKAGLMMTSPTIFNAYHLGDMPGGILPAIPDVIYGGQYNDRLYADLTANWGGIDLEVGKAISINNAMNSNLMNAVYDATDLKMYVAYAEDQDRAANREYVLFDFNWPTKPVAAAIAVPMIAYVGQTITFSAAGSSHANPNHRIVAYDWDWTGDGTYDASGVTVPHAFAAAGTYNVTLRVTDDFIPGQTATATVPVTITERPLITNFAINDGASVTTALAVKLSVECAGVDRMRFRNEGGAWSAWMPYATTADWQLAGGAEGWRRVDAQCITADGYGTYAVKALIYYDTPAASPSGTVAINDGARYTNNLNATLMLYGKGATGVRLKSRYSDAWGPWQAYAALTREPYGQTMAWTLLAGGEGQRAVYVQYRDSYGNTSAPRCATIIYDTPAPPALTLTINRGASYTSSAAVTLRFSLAGTVAKELRLRNSEADPWTDWVRFDWTMAWALAAGADGRRTVYAQARDYLGNLSATASASIGLDGPEPPVGRIRINDGALMTLLLDVTVNCQVTGAARMRFKQAWGDAWGAWMPFAASTPMKLRSGADGLREVYAQFIDGVGNLSAVMCATITYETFAPPVVTYFRIGSSEQTASLGVTLNIAATDAAEMRFRNSGSAEWSAWRPYAVSTDWTLAEGADGPRIVYAQCRDYLGEPSNTMSDSITLAR
jgi:PKD repeat protein